MMWVPLLECGPVLPWLLFFAFCWILNAIIIRTPLFPKLFRVPRMEYQKKKRIKSLKRQVVAEIEQMSPEQRKNTNWSFYARDTLYARNCYGMTTNELYRFICTTMHKRGWEI
ncbi:hypothetical protein [uncultured Dysosmobacter sp.]|uniref:hypothetical protein n=1 Tax=uncultured Dysosmobacter sp. TaxID=2591384 RepID=UPI002602760D|nr:hypothetical protein [uncultured Dysosmobacter sp.]